MRSGAGLCLQGLRLLSLGLACLLGAGSLACRSEPTATGGFPRHETLYVGGPQWGEPASFNPLASNPDWPVKTPCNLLYQSLLDYDASSGEMRPSLATSHRMDPKGVEITLDPRARWSDGAPVSVEDVLYTFELGRQHKSFPQASIWAYLSRIAVGSLEQVLENEPPATAETAPAGAAGEPAAAAGERRITFVFAPQARNPLFVLDALQETRIIPKHVIAPLLRGVNHDQAEFLKLQFDRDPIVSGPYRLHSYGSEKIALERRDDYWGNAAFFDGKLAGPKYVVHPVYKSNDHYSVALQQGRLDFSSNFVPRIWLKHRKGVRAWFDEPPYFVANSMPMMLINVARPPLGDVAYRRAMALSVNYRDVRELAVSGYSAALEPGLILPFGPEAKFHSRADTERWGATRHDPDAARRELSRAGYEPVFDAAGNLLETRKGGQRVPTITIKSPTGWTDWESIVRIAVKGMRSVGIDVRERFVDGSVFWQATATGDFDLIMNTPKPAPLPSQPWSRFDALLTTKDWKPVGEKMYKNQSRFNDPTRPGHEPRFDELLELLPTLTDEAELIAAYRELNVLFMQHQPALPMVYRPTAFYQVSTRVWSGFPSAEDPFLPPEFPGERLGTRILWHLAVRPNE